MAGIPLGILFDHCRKEGVECIVLLAKGDEINSVQMSMSTVSSSMRRSIAMLNDPPFCLGPQIENMCAACPVDDGRARSSEEVSPE